MNTDGSILNTQDYKNSEARAALLEDVEIGNRHLIFYVNLLIKYLDITLFMYIKYFVNYKNLFLIEEYCLILISNLC